MLLLFIALSTQPLVSPTQKLIDATPNGETLTLPAGLIQGPLSISNRSDLKIIATDVHVRCGPATPCLSISGSSQITIEGLWVEGDKAQGSTSVEVLKSTDVLLRQVKLQHVGLKVEAGALEIDQSILWEVGEMGKAMSIDSSSLLTVQGSSILGGGYFADTSGTVPERITLTNNTFFLSLYSTWEGVNSKGNLLSSASPVLKHSPNHYATGIHFVNSVTGDLRLFDTTSVPQASGKAQYGAHPVLVPAIDTFSYGDGYGTLGVLGWSESGALLTWLEPLEDGHGFCAMELRLTHVPTGTTTENAFCDAGDEGPWNMDWLQKDAARYASVFNSAELLGVRKGLGSTITIETRLGHDSPRQVVWLDRGETGLDPWWSTDRFQHIRPDLPSVLTVSPDGSERIWVVGDELIPVPPLPVAQETCGVSGLERGTSLTQASNRTQLYGAEISGSESLERKPLREAGSGTKLQYAGRVSCESGHGPKQAVGLWVQALTSYNDVVWVHSSELAEGSTAWVPVPHTKNKALTEFSSPFGDSTALSIGQIVDFRSEGSPVVGWSPDGAALLHGGYAAALMVTSTVLLEPNTDGETARHDQTWEETPAGHRVDSKRERAELEGIASQARALGIDPRLGRTQRVRISTAHWVEGSDWAAQPVCISTGGDLEPWMATPTRPRAGDDLILRVTPDEVGGVWLSEGPTGEHLLIGEYSWGIYRLEKVLEPEESLCYKRRR
ncbi:MAG: hypothetical protein ACI9VR_004338 [Cognaticolwellia sp.]|jgi:hypothetical protein